MKRILTFLLILSALIGPIGFIFSKKAEANPGDTLIIRATPPYPAAFQRVYLTLDTPTRKVDGISQPDLENSISWKINGVAKDICNDNNFCNFMVGTAGNRFDQNNSHKFLINAVWDGESGSKYTGNITVTPFLNDFGQRDNLTDSLSCTADTLDALADDIDNTEQLINDTINQVDDMATQLDDDIDFVQNLSNIQTQIDNLKQDVDGIQKAAALQGSTDTIQGKLRYGAVILRATIDAYLYGNTAQTIAHLEAIIARYKNMKSTLIAMKNARVRYMKNMLNQIERQGDLCKAQWSKVNTH